MSTSTRSSSSRTPRPRASPDRLGGLPIQPVGRDQLLRARLFQRDVDAHPARRRSRAPPAPSASDRDARRDPRAGSAREPFPPTATAAAAGVSRVIRPAMNAAPIRITIAAVNASRAGESTNHANQSAAARAAPARAVPTSIRSKPGARIAARCRRTPSRAAASCSSPGTRRRRPGAPRARSSPAGIRRSSGGPGRRRSDVMSVISYQLPIISGQ